MILIDKSRATQTIVFYTSRFTDDAAFQLEIKSDSTSAIHTFQLINNLSSDFNRSFIYELATSSFEEVEAGLYNYSITADQVSTSGKLMILDVANDDVVKAFETDTENYKVFNG
ncbi:hypothetical protein [Pedobacter sp. CFBP9032]|uniref:hypothetical protein n=1 Tax=Pedobacter sp. CFBP9032 TaxID=3096539 RepID=UPI002A6B81D5|nr:hypothetical protein [Pedobacter sp. CFBP9032]MDY0906570.1 hypothetical protein [Pedobacter sp. CFBP9032]